MASTHSLYRLAGDGKLPNHQVMDAHTVAWIGCGLIDGFHDDWSRPLSKTIDHITSGLVPAKNSLYCNADVYLDTNQFFGIHGARHAARVRIFTDWISLKSANISLKSLHLSALYHDTQRRNDKSDIGHGDRAATYLKNRFDPSQPSNVIDIASIISSYHEIDYKNIPAYVLANHSTDIIYFKAADALDRTRLPSRRWWPHPSYIPELLHEFVRPASALTFIHEAISLDEMDCYESLKQALCLLNVYLMNDIRYSDLIKSILSRIKI